MAKKYNHEKQTSRAGKAKDEKKEKHSPRLISNSPNPEENRSYPVADSRKKKLMAKKEKEEDKKARGFGPKFDAKKRPSERTSPNESSRPFAAKSREGFKPRLEGRPPVEKGTGFKKRAGFRENEKYTPDTKVRREDESWATVGRNRAGFEPRSDDDNRNDEDGWASAGKKRGDFNLRSAEKPPLFEKGSGLRKDEEPRDKKKRVPETRNRKEKQSNRADSGRRPRYSEDTMKSKLSVKVREKVVKQESKHTDGTIRLNRYIANAGVCSRREADELIAEGKVTVNGNVVTELGSRVMPEDIVTFNGKTLERENFVYVLLNKPKDFITTTEDPEERKTVMEIIAEAASERIYPVGRLDRKTTGLLLFTNDGKLAEKLSHPSSKVTKIYQAELDKPITEEHFDAIVAGIELEDGFVKPDELALITPDAEVVGIQIHSGKNRIVRRIFEHFDYKVQKLDRTVYAGLTKKDLPRGKWRYLSEKEVIKLKYLS